MGRFIFVTLLILAAIAAFVGANSMFIVKETEQALVLRFGAVQRQANAWAPDAPGPGQASGAGLQFKYPWEDVILFDRRNLDFESAAQEIFSADQERLVVDTFVRYRIANPLRFYQTVTSEPFAIARLEPILQANVRSALGGVASSDIVSGQRAGLMLTIRDGVNAQVSDPVDGLGIEIIDVKIRQVELPPQNAEGVYARMQTQRQQEAARIRAEGAERAQLIRAEADREARVVVAEASEQGEIIQGQGDAERNRIFAAAHGLDPEFFAFYRAMIAYEASIQSGTTMVLSPDSEFFEYFNDGATAGR